MLGTSASTSAFLFTTVTLLDDRHPGFEALEAAVNAGQLAEFWENLFSGAMARPSGEVGAVGHLSVPRIRYAVDNGTDWFKSKGIYVWGAWAGGDARPLYVGITDKYFGHRFRNRYVAGPHARGTPNGLRREIDYAEHHGPTLIPLREAFDPGRAATVGLERLRQMNLPVHPRYVTRPARSERYATPEFACL